MKFFQPQTLQQIALILDCDYIGDENFPVLGMNEIHVVKSGDIVFVDHPKYYDKALKSDATIILINKIVKCPQGKALLISENPFDDFNKLTKYFRPFVSSSVSINPGVTSKTTINFGTKLDNQIQIGHDTIIGKNCLIASQTGIAGCCVIEDDVTIWGQVGTNSGITIGSNSTILGQTGVTKSVAGSKTYFGTPIEESRLKLKELAILRKLPEIVEKFKEK